MQCLTQWRYRLNQIGILGIDVPRLKNEKSKKQKDEESDNGEKEFM